MRVRELIRRGDPAIWFTGTGLAISLLMITGMVGLILVNGLGFFWPRPLTRATLKDSTILLGEIVTREGIPAPGTPQHNEVHRLQFKLGNRDILGADFRWVDEAEVTEQTRPREVAYIERREYGPLIGTPVRLLEGEREITGADPVWQALTPIIDRAEDDRDRIRDIERNEIGAINASIEEARLELRRGVEPLPVDHRYDP